MQRQRSASALAATLALLFVLGIVAVAGYSLGDSWNNCCVDGNMKTITISSASLFSGTYTNSSHRGTSVLAIVLDNPSSRTTIQAITVTGQSLTTRVTFYRCAAPTNCEPISSVPLPGGIIHFDTNASAFYLSSSGVTEGQVYDYLISFANGQSISGSLTAQGPSKLTGVSPDNTAIITSECASIAPYTTTMTVHYGNDSAVTLESATITCGPAAQSTAYISSTFSTCTDSPYVTTQTINSSLGFYTTLATAYQC